MVHMRWLVRLSCIINVLFLDVLLMGVYFLCTLHGKDYWSPVLLATFVHTHQDTVSVTQHVSNECGCGPGNRLEGIIWGETLAIQKLGVRESQEPTIINSLGLRRELPQSNASFYQNRNPRFYISQQSQPVQVSAWANVGYSPLATNR